MILSLLISNPFLPAIVWLMADTLLTIFLTLRRSFDWCSAATSAQIWRSPL